MAVGRLQTTDIVALARRLAITPAEMATSPVDLRPFDVLMGGTHAL